MPNDFSAFLKKHIHNSNIHEKWDNTQINRVEIYKSDRMWRIYLNTSQFYQNHIIKETSSLLSNSLPFLDSIQIITEIEEQSIQLTKYIEKNEAKLLSKLLLNFPGKKTNLSTMLEWKAEGHKIDFYIKDKQVYDYFLSNDYCSKITAWFYARLAINVLARVILVDEIPNRENKVHYIKEKPLHLIESTVEKDKNISNNYPKKRKSRKNIEGEIKEKSMLIKELEEGLRVAVVEGEIWNKEINYLRDGSLVIAYYLSDYEDSIVIKSFYKSADEDNIPIGSWIKIKGSIRYDDYLKEIVLFMDQYSFQVKKQREDLSEHKRVELHAHTKMSAMDSLTEVEDLVKRAAEWNHPAIAITDHGCAQSFPLAYATAKKHGIKLIYGVEAYLIEENKKEKPFHIILLAKNAIGLKNLYRLISISYLEYYYRHPKIPREILNQYREGIIIGSACEAGELYQAVLKDINPEELEKMASYYDYLEIQPIVNNQYLINQGIVESELDLQKNNAKIVKLGEKLNKPVVATGDVHFLEPHHEIFRRIVQSGQGYSDAESQAPLFLRTTDEMINEFTYLGEELAKKVVIDYPNSIMAQIEEMGPVPDGFYPPKIEGSEEEVTLLTWNSAHNIYGEELPEIVKDRVVRELDAINKHGFSVLYLISHKLVKKSNEEGYLVGSRGSVGSSLVAFFTGITDVNPLEPHYICPQCYYFEVASDPSIGAGVDLEEKNCPQCQERLNKDGFNIPFETFLGFEGDKVPDIDLNFSGDYQSRAHQYVEELFGKENVFRAGTISTIAEKTAFGFVKKYAEAKGVNIRNAEIKRMVKGIAGVRKTTGQHPGGIIVLPKDSEIYSFTPLQHPADNKDSGIITTHFDYHAIDNQLVKLDILGHDAPTVIKKLEDLTGIKQSSIQLGEIETMKLFSSTEPLGVEAEDIDTCVGTYGIPEFGTKFVRQMLEATRPKTFADLVRISGLSHGTDVWSNNAQTLIENRVAPLSEVICTRDDIMTYLIQQGLEKRQAFKIMENVRKGKGLSNDEVINMQECKVPEWYITSCQKIQYMFPKAHAVAYVSMSFKIAYYKVYYPLAFYASFFSVRAEDFDFDTILKGYNSSRERIKEINKQGYDALPKDKKLIPSLEIAMEMYARGFTFYPVDIYQSAANEFIIKEKGLLLPFSALPNVGESAAQGIVEARKSGEFVSIEEFQQTTKLNKTAMEILRKNECFGSLPESTQIDLFA